MGNWCCCCAQCTPTKPPSIPLKERSTALDTAKDEKLRALVEQWLSNLEVLRLAQRTSHTKMGLRVARSSTAIILTKDEVDIIAADETASEQVRLIMNSPFNEVSRITDNLFLTGVSGLTVENMHFLNLNIVLNATFEMPLVIRPNMVSVRVPVDDDPDDDIYFYLDDASDLIQQAAQEGFRSVVHCVAGASRSSTIVLAYLIKHLNFSLKDAFCYVQACRPCARPNMGFFRQLIQFESDVRGKNSVHFVEYATSGYKIRVPHFYKTEYPELFVAEAKHQLQHQLRGGKTEEVPTMPKVLPSGETRAKFKMMASRKTQQNTPTSKGKPKVYLKDAYDEINKIRIRSFYSQA